MIGIDQKNGAYRVSVEYWKDGKRIRKTKRLPKAVDIETARMVERRMLGEDCPALADALRGCPAGRAGVVYALKNEGAPGLIKVGMTRNSVWSRIKNLSTGYPQDWEVVEECGVKDPEYVERALHAHWSLWRETMNRELFRIEEAEVRKAFAVCRELCEVDLSAAINVIGAKR